MSLTNPKSVDQTDIDIALETAQGIEDGGEPTAADCIRACASAAQVALNNTHLESEREVLSTELAQSRQRVDFFVVLLARFWNFSPLDVKAPDGRTFQFVDPDPHRTLRVIKEAMAEALADSQVAARAAAEPDDEPIPHLNKLVPGCQCSGCVRLTQKSTARLAGCSNWKPKHGVGPYCGNCGFHVDEHQR